MFPELCRDTPHASFCTNLLESVYGFSTHLNTTREEVFLSQFPAGSSMKNVRHFAQLTRVNRFGRFDYGAERNVKEYGAAHAPDYDFLGFLLSRLFIVLTIFVIGGIVAVADSRSAVVSYGPVIIAYLVSLFCYNLRHPASIVCLALTTSLYAQSLAWQPAQPDGSFTMFIMERPQVCFATPAEAGWFTCPTCGSHVAKYGMLSNITSNSNNLLERFSIYLTFVQHDLHTPDLSNPKNIDLGYEGVFPPLFHNAW